MNSEFNSNPYIRLQGKWLNEVGFKIGSQFIAEIENNKITLKIID